MAVSKLLIEKIVLPYTINCGGYVLLQRKNIDAVKNALFLQFDSIYTDIIEDKKFRDCFVVGNVSCKRACKPIFKIYIED